MQGLATKKSQAHMERKRALAGHEKRENEFTATKKKVLDDSNRLSEKLEKQRESIIALRHQYRHLAALIQGLEADVNQSTNALAMLRGSLLTFNRNRTGQSDKKEAKEEYSRAETAIVPLFILFFRQPV